MDVFFKFLTSDIEACWVFVFDIDSLGLLYVFINTRLFHQFSCLIEKLIGRKENENTTSYSRGLLCDCLTQLNFHLQVVPILIIEHESFVSIAFWKSLNEYLIIWDDVTILKMDLKRHLKLCLEGIDRLQSARSDEDWARFIAVELFEAVTRV